MSQLRSSTDRLTASAVISKEPAALYGVFVETDGSHNVTLTIYDNASAAAGKIIRKITVPGANFYGGWEFPYGLKAANGIYALIAGTGAAYWVTWSRTTGY